MIMPTRSSAPNTRFRRRFSRSSSSSVFGRLEYIEEGIYRTGMSNAEWSQPRMQTLMTIKASHIRHPPRDLGPFAHPSGPDGFFNPSANPALKSSHFCMTEVV